MNKKVWMYSVACIFMACQSHAADDVYVDLSVLDSVQHDSIGFVHSSPAFPVVTKKSAAVSAKNAVSSKGKLRKVRKVTSQSVVAVQPVKPKVVDEGYAPKVFEKEGTVNREGASVQVQTIQERSETSAALENKTNPSVQNQEEQEKVLTAEPQQIQPEENTKKTLQAEEKAEVVSRVEEKAEAVLQAKETPQAEENAGETLKQETSQLLTDNETQEMAERQQSVSDENVLSAKISDMEKEESTSVALPREVYSIVFDLDSSELSENNIRYLSDLVSKFDSSKKKKISIKAYNYDNGEDSFRKKRVSLIRATEVRSYFLNQGFKNFSIKIINTTADSEDKNSVEIEEIN